MRKTHNWLATKSFTKTVYKSHNYTAYWVAANKGKRVASKLRKYVMDGDHAFFGI